MSLASKDAYEVPGKLEIPYRYFAGQCGSRFLTALRDEKKILATRCPRCKVNFVPPRSLCSKCYGKIADWVEVGPAGVVTSYTVVRYPEPFLPYPPPFILAQIKLDQADTALTHVVRELEPAEMKLGLRVEPVFAEKRQARITDIAYFKPARSERLKQLKQEMEKTAKIVEDRARKAEKKIAAEIPAVKKRAAAVEKKAAAAAGKARKAAKKLIAEAEKDLAKLLKSKKAKQAKAKKAVKKVVKKVAIKAPAKKAVKKVARQAPARKKKVAKKAKKK